MIKKFLSILLVSVTCTQSQTSVKLNEIMFYPSSGNNEFIEVYNSDSTESINLNGFKIKYYTASADIITDAGDGTILNPQSYAVIFEGDYDFVSGIYNNLIPADALILKITDNSFGATGMSNTSDRSLWFISADDDTIDVVTYTADNSQTHSDEKIHFEADSLQVNWNNSTLVNGTPGFRNSVTPLNFNLTVSSINVLPEILLEGDDVSIKSIIKNSGENTAGNFSISMFNDINLDSIPQAGEQILLQNYYNLDPGDSVSVSADIQSAPSGFYNVIVTIDYSSDENNSDNIASKSFKVYPPGAGYNEIVINEIMYAPLTGEPEWIEIFNVSPDSVNLNNWSVSDILNTTTQKLITNNNFYLYSGEFAVIAKDSSFHFLHPDLSNVFITGFGTLGNTEDGAVLYDDRNIVIDSVFYYSTWGGEKGYSLERISSAGLSCDSSNWTTSLCADKSTPGKENSIAYIQEGNRNSLVINEIMFDPGIDNCEFIEFYNISPDSINIGGWHIQDETGNSNKVSGVNFYIAPGSYFLLAADSLLIQKYSLEGFNNISVSGTSGLGLSNDEDLILLKDFRGNTIDSAFYSSGWHNRNINITKNKSLERINPCIDGNNAFNWSTSVCDEGATPGKQNSIFTDNSNRDTHISVSPNPFSPDNDGFEDFSIINYTLSQPVSQIRIKVFDNRGRLVRTIVNNKASASQGSVIFDGLGDDGRALRMGIYVIFLEALNSYAGTVENLKTVVVVARRL